MARRNALGMHDAHGATVFRQIHSRVGSNKEIKEELRDFAQHEISRRYRPTGIEPLMAKTKFTSDEIKLLYRSFKQSCPTAIVTRETFKDIFCKLFPGDADEYAGFVFNTFDRDKNGMIDFEEFVTSLSVISRGSLQEKLDWVFQLYDVKNKQVITRYELHRIIASIYRMLGAANPPYDASDIYNHVESIWSKMDVNGDGVISKTEFIETCTIDPSICQSLHLFDTVMVIDSDPLSRRAHSFVERSDHCCHKQPSTRKKTILNS